MRCATSTTASWLARRLSPANLYAQGAVEYALDAAKGVKLKVGQPGIGAPSLQNVSFLKDTNLGDPIVGPLVTKTATPFNVKGIAGAPGKFTSIAVTNPTSVGQRVRQGSRRRLRRRCEPSR